MKNDTLYVGLDTDKKRIDIAIAEPGRGGEVRYIGSVENDWTALQRRLRRFIRDWGHLEVCYEAGPCGYGLHRQLEASQGISCQVIAPSMTPRRSGDRVKTNRRDALSLARLHRAGELTAIWVPDPDHEAMRDLVRARAGAVEDMRRCRQRITGFLLRQDIRYQGSSWTKTHRVWLGQLAFEALSHRLMFQEYLDALDQATARCGRLRDHIAELVPGWSLAWLVEALQHLRGIALINAVTIVAEIGDLRRFDKPAQLMAFLGLTASERSTGDRVRRGGLTKTGNRRARTALVEAAWTYSRPSNRPKSGIENAPPQLREIADTARHRLSGRYRKLIARGKSPQIAVSAVARELAGFIWAVAYTAAPRD